MSPRNTTDSYYNPRLTVPMSVQERLYRKVEDLLGVTTADLKVPGKGRDLSTARRAILLALDHFDPQMTVRQRANAIYRGDHSTAIYHLKLAREAYDTDPLFRQQVDHLKAAVGVKENHLDIHDLPQDVQALQRQVVSLQDRCRNYERILADLGERINFVLVQLTPHIMRDKDPATGRPATVPLDVLLDSRSVGGK